MAVPPTYSLHDLGPQAQMMSRHCNNERLAMILQYVAIGSMIIMAGAAAAHILKDLFGHTEHHGRSPWTTPIQPAQQPEPTICRNRRSKPSYESPAEGQPTVP